MTVHVLARHIAMGSRRLACACPVALAVSELLPGALVFVWPAKLVVDGRPYYLPQRVWDWIVAFDTGAAVEPFSFELDAVPAESGVAA